MYAAQLRDFQQWIVQSCLTVYGIASAVPSWGTGEAHPSYPMKIAHKPALYRLQYIVTRLVQGDQVTAGRMAAQLEVSIRTVMRDIDYLINVLHVPVRYDHTMRSYVLRGSLPLLFSLSSIQEQTSTDENIDVVILRVDADIVEHLERQILHPTQQLEFANDGSVRVRLRMALTDALVHWILSQAGRVQVVQPLALREQVIGAARQILARQESVY